MIAAPTKSAFADLGRPLVQRFALHGLAVELQCSVPALQPELHHLLNPFAVTDWPDGFNAVSGRIEPFDAAVVQRRVSVNAVPFAASREMIELYQDGERFWLIDDRWGMTELDILRGQWRSWVLPHPTTDALRCAEMAMLWPLAQLLRAKGLHLLPAVSVSRGGWGALIFSPFSIEPELTALVRSGYRVIGQRWTAVREEDGRLAMLHMPGLVERTTAPRLRSMGLDTSAVRVDLAGEFPGSEQRHNFCDAVLIADPGRRPTAHLRSLGHSAAMNVLRRAWPVVDLMPQRRAHQLPPRLAQHCRCSELQLSREPYDLLALLEGVRETRPSVSRSAITSPLELHLYLKSPRSLAT